MDLSYLGLNPSNPSNRGWSLRMRLVILSRVLFLIRDVVDIQIADSSS